MSKNANYKIRTLEVELRCSGCNTLLRATPGSSTFDSDQLKKAKTIDCPGCEKANTLPAKLKALFTK